MAAVQGSAREADMPPYNKRIPRLFLDRDLTRDSAALTERETNYLGNVLRLKRGDHVLAFNGRGQEREATISSLARRHAELALLDHVAPMPESQLRLTLLQSLPKTDAMDLIVQKITELGVHALWPIMTDFSVVKLDAERAAKRADHWIRVARSACEQCGRHRPPDIKQVNSLEESLADVPASGRKLVLEAGSASGIDLEPAAVDDVFLIVGPEGGFSPADLDSIDAGGFSRMRLGPRTLRAETAAIVATGLLQALWGDLR